MPGGARFDLAGHAAEAAQQQLLEVPAGAVGAEEPEVVQVQISREVGVADLVGVDLMQPVLLGERLADVVVHARDRLLGVGVFLDAPVAVAHILGEHVDRRADEGVCLARAAALLPVEDVRLGGLGVAVFDEHLLDEVLHLFHLGRAVGELRVRQDDHLIGQLLGAAPVAAAHRDGRLIDGAGDFFRLKGDDLAAALANRVDHCKPFLTRYCVLQIVLYDILYVDAIANTEIFSGGAGLCNLAESARRDGGNC